MMPDAIQNKPFAHTNGEADAQYAAFRSRTGRIALLETATLEIYKRPNKTYPPNRRTNLFVAFADNYTLTRIEDNDINQTDTVEKPWQHQDGRTPIATDKAYGWRFVGPDDTTVTIDDYRQEYSDT